MVEVNCDKKDILPEEITHSESDSSFTENVNRQNRHILTKQHNRHIFRDLKASQNHALT